MPRRQPWGDFSRLLAGLPFDVQAQLYNQLRHRKDLDPAALSRLPQIHTSGRLNVTAGGQAVGAWRFQTLTAVYGISRSQAHDEERNQRDAD